MPVGKDQLAHLELTMEISRLFNNLYKKEVFPYPDAILTQTPKLLGLDGRKMSKSYLNTINLSDTADTILKKISTMFTDPKRIKLSDEGNPEVCNVALYYETFAPKFKNEVYDWCKGAKIGCTECKKRLAVSIIEKLKSIQEKRAELNKDKSEIKKILEQGDIKASSYAEATLKEVRKVMGL